MEKIFVYIESTENKTFEFLKVKDLKFAETFKQKLESSCKTLKCSIITI